MPLTVGGGIRGFTDANGVTSSALQVADAYFRAGADKISIGSDAVEVAKKFLNTGRPDGSTSIEQISHVYGRQDRGRGGVPVPVWLAARWRAYAATAMRPQLQSRRPLADVDRDLVCLTGSGGVKHPGWDCVHASNLE